MSHGTSLPRIDMPLEVKFVGESGQFEGYAAVFDVTDDVNERIRQMEQKGHADPLTEMKVNRLNGEISRAIDAAEAAKRRVDLVETALSRAPASKGDEWKEAETFMLERKHHLAQGFGEYRIPVHEQYAEPRATQKLLDDAMFNAEEWLAGKIAERLARMENEAFVHGNGVRKPRGFLTYAAGTPSASTFNVIEQLVTGQSGAFASSNPGDALINLVYALKSAYRDKAVFMMKRSTLAAVRKLKDGDGNYLWQPDFQLKQGGTLLGFDVIEAEDMPAIAANSLSIAFGDFSAGYQIVDRQGVRILRDSFTAKPYVKFYTTKRTGGDVMNFEAIKLLKFSAS